MSPPSITAKISRRQMLKTLAAGAAGAAAAATMPAGLTASLPRAQSTYKGRIVIMTVSAPEQSADLIKAIEAATPGVTVEWRNLTSEKFVELFSASDLAGEQIDLMDLNGQDLRRYATGGKLVDLTDIIKYKDRFLDVSTGTYTIGSKLWALPRGGVSGFTFLYNKMLLDKVGMTTPPNTYDDLKTLAPELKKLGVPVFVHQGKNIYLWPVWQFWAYAQTSGNQAIEKTIKTLQGDLKFTDPEQVAALEILYNFKNDGMFPDNVLSIADDAQTIFESGKAAFWYWGPWEVPNIRKAQKPADGSANKLPNMDISLIPPVLAVKDSSIKRQMPGGVGNALGMYYKIAPERRDVALGIMDLMTSDKWVKWANDLGADPVSSNKNVTASDDPAALLYAKTCAPNQITYLDWLWPPEVTHAFQQNQQAIVAGTMKPDAAAAAIQKVFDQAVADGYVFGK